MPAMLCYNLHNDLRSLLLLANVDDLFACVIIVNNNALRRQAVTDTKLRSKAVFGT